MYSLKNQLEWDKTMPILLKIIVILKINQQTKKSHQNMKYMVGGRGWSSQTSCCIATFYYLTPDSY